MIWPLLLLAAAPSDEALAYARIVAANGTLATIGPLIARQEVEDLFSAHPELAEPEKARLRALGEELAARQGAQVVEAEAQAFAAQLSLEDLRELARFSQTDAARHLREKFPQVAAQTMGNLSTIDFGGDLRRSFCAETGKICTD